LLLPTSFLKSVFPDGVVDPNLRSFFNAILHCHSASDVCKTLNEAIEIAEQKAGCPLKELSMYDFPSWAHPPSSTITENRRASKATSPTDQNGATDSTRLSATLRQKIINDYGALIERRPPIPTRIEDIAALPHPKEQILDALLMEIVRGHSEHIDNMMRVGAINLAQYQAGVGDDPLEMLGVDITKLPDTHDLGAVKAQMKLISEAGSKTRKRFDEFNTLVTEDMKRINAKIAAAHALGQAMPEEQKKRVLR